MLGTKVYSYISGGTEYCYCLDSINHKSNYCSYRVCYFTSESTNRKSDFIRELNASYKQACLQCSFSDKELSEYIQFKKRKSVDLPVKYAVSNVGQQSDSVWVLGSGVYISDEGEEISAEQSKHVWIGNIYHGPGVASSLDQCTIELPLRTEPLAVLLLALKQSMKHNFFPCLITMAGSIMALHYQQFIEKLKCCPILFAYGKSGSGKTTALLSGLSLFGADNLRFFRGLSSAKVTQLCSITNIPLGLDDPDTKGGFNKAIMDLFNGAKQGTISRGEFKPKSTVVITSNITPFDQQR